MAEKKEPRFHPRFRKLVKALPVPEGKMLHKLDGHPVVISDREPDEPLFGKTQFTERQLRELADLATHKKIALGERPFPAGIYDLSGPHVGWRLFLAHDAQERSSY